MSYSKQNFRSGDTLYASQLNAMDDEIAALEAEVESTKNMVGSPLTASTAAGMTDQTKIYVYTGTETGYTAGHWYYYNGTAWTDGGVYNSVAVNTDTSLTVSGQAADSKAVGDAIDDLDSDLSDVKSDLNDIADGEPGTNLFDENFDESGYIDSNGVDQAGSNYKRTSKYTMIGEHSGGYLYYLSTKAPTTFRLRFYNAQGSYTGVGSADGVTTKIFAIPEGSTKFRAYTDASFDGKVCVSKTSQSSYVPYQLQYKLKDGSVSFDTLDENLQGMIGDGGDTKYVRFDDDQELTSAEKETARANIGANYDDAITGLSIKLDSITGEITSANLFDENFDESGYIDTSGNNASGSNYKRTSGYTTIGVNTGVLYLVSTKATPTFVLRFYANDGSYTGGGSYTNKTSGTISVPTNSVKFRAYTDASFDGNVCISVTQQSEYVPYESDYGMKDNVVKYRNLDEDLQEILDNAEAADVVKKVKTSNIFDENFDESGLINSNGSNESNSSYKRTSQYTEIGENSGTLYIILTESTSTFRLRFYDDQNGYTGTGACNNALSASVSVPTGSTKFRVYTMATFSGNSCISTTVQSEYEPKEDYTKLIDDIVSFTSLDDNLKNKVAWLANKTIVFMGDSIIGNFYDGTGVCAQLAKETGASVINCAFGGTQMAMRNSTIQNVQYWNTLSGYKLSEAIASGVWTDQDTAVANITGGIDYFPTRLSTLKSVDFSTVDIIMWEWGTNDFSNEHIPIKNTEDLTDQYSYYGAYCHCIETLLTAYPHLRIIPVTPMWRYWQDSQNDHAYLYGSDEHEMGGQLLPNFAKCAMEVAEKYHLPYIDDYYGLDANKWTRQQYFDVTDSVHPNANGRSRIASHIAHKLISLL